MPNASSVLDPSTAVTLILSFCIAVDTPESVGLLRAELQNRIERLTREHRQENLDIRAQLRGLVDLRESFAR